MKKILALLMCILTLGTGAVHAEQPNQTTPIAVKIQQVDGVAYLPLRESCDKLGYTLVWNAKESKVTVKGAKGDISFVVMENKYEKRTVEHGKGLVQLTSLSYPAMVRQGRTYVPAEFFPTLLNQDITGDKGVFVLGGQPHMIAGIVREVDPGQFIRISSQKKDDTMEGVVLNLSRDTIINGGDIKVGDTIVAYTSVAMTRSLPPQTAAFVIYKSKIGVQSKTGTIQSIQGNCLELLCGDMMSRHYVDEMEATSLQVHQKVVLFDNGIKVYVQLYRQGN